MLFSLGGSNQGNAPSPANAPSPMMNPGSVNSIGSHPASGCSTPASYLGVPSPSTQTHGPGTPGGNTTTGTLPVGGAEGSHTPSPATSNSGQVE